LPDYMGDVKKILMSRASVVPSGKFVSDGVLELTGTVEYDILYADSENKLTAINTAADYTIPVGVNGEGYIGSYADIRSATPVIRLTGPRKLTVKSVIEAQVTVSEGSEITVGGDVFAEEREIEKLVRTVNVESAVYGKGLEREYAEEAERIPDTSAEDIEIIGTGGTVRVIEVSAEDGGVRIKGELIINAIVRTEGQPPFAIRRAIPFEELVEVDGMTAGMQAVADGYLTSVVAGVCDEGEEAVVTFNIIAEFDAVGYYEEEMEVVADAYLKDAQTSAKYSSLNYKRLGACQINEATVNDKVSRASIGIADINDILILFADVKSCEAEAGAGGVNISGEIAYSGVACEINADNSVTYLPIKFTAPYSVNVNNSSQISAGSIAATVSAVSCEGTLDADDLYIKCTLKVKVKNEIEDNISVMSECVITGEATPPCASRITVYYPSREDTLFSVAKLFHTTTERIAKDNSIAATASVDSSDALVGVKRIIIK